MHIYAFGSVCRGEICESSDIDLLVIQNDNANFDRSRFDPRLYSVYGVNRLVQLWQEGSPFAWHLATEAKLIYASDGVDCIKQFGKPSHYRNVVCDCRRFYDLVSQAVSSLAESDHSVIFDLGMVFLGIRNFAICYSLGAMNRPQFSRHVALQLQTESLSIDIHLFEILERARILSVRGIGSDISRDEIRTAINGIGLVLDWMSYLLTRLEERR